jgi:predicted RNA-binding protein YlqC (UPF0109 family)
MSEDAQKSAPFGSAPVGSPQPASGQPTLRELVDYLARGLVDRPEEVEVEEISEPDALVFELKVAEEDLGKVIGKQGRTAKALRTILSAASAKTRRRVILEILE